MRGPMNSRLFSSLEPLECRIAPAGIVKVAFAGGTLTLTGDAADNVIEIDPTDSTQVHLIGTAGTQFQFGAGAPVGDLFLSALSGDVKVALGDGDDTVKLSTGLFPRNVVLDGGGPSKTVPAPVGNVFNLAGVSVAGSLTIVGKAGADLVNATGALLSIGRDLNLLPGDGNNTVTLNVTSLDVSGKLNYTGGKDVDIFGLPGANILVSGDTTIKTGKFADFVTINPSDSATFGGKLTIASAGAVLGAGISVALVPTNDLTIRGALTLTGTDGTDGFTIKPGDDLTVNDKVSVSTGKGAGDNVEFHGDVARFLGDFSIKTAADPVIVDVGATTSYLVAGNFSYVGGGANNIVTLKGPGAILGASTFDLSAKSEQVLTLDGDTGQLLLVGPTNIKMGGKTGGINVATLSKVNALSALNITAGAAIDVAIFDNVALHGASRLSFGAGNDVFDYERNAVAGSSTVFAALTVLLGDGDDTARIGDSSADKRVIFNAASTIDAGKGTDTTITVSTGNVFNQALTVLNSENAT